MKSRVMMRVDVTSVHALIDLCVYWFYVYVPALEETLNLGIRTRGRLLVVGVSPLSGAQG